jgi:hypothetical protein
MYTPDLQTENCVDLAVAVTVQNAVETKASRAVLKNLPSTQTG